MGLNKPAFAMRLVTSRDEGVAWLAKQLAARS